MRKVAFSVVLFFMGCATVTEFYVKTDKGLELVGKIKQDAPGQATIEKDGVKMSVDTRKLSWWERNVTPIFVKTMSSVTPQIETK